MSCCTTTVSGMLGHDGCRQRRCWSALATIVTCSRTFDDGLFSPDLGQVEPCVVRRWTVLVRRGGREY